MEPNDQIQVFDLGQKVFGKLGGYAPWPAKIIEICDNNNYKVFFYGTYDSAVLPFKKLFMYETNKEDLSTRCEKKSFKLALEEIEKDPPGCHVPNYGTRPINSLATEELTVDESSSKDSDEDESDDEFDPNSITVAKRRRNSVGKTAPNKTKVKENKLYIETDDPVKYIHDYIMKDFMVSIPKSNQNPKAPYKKSLDEYSAEGLVNALHFTAKNDKGIVVFDVRNLPIYTASKSSPKQCNKVVQDKLRQFRKAKEDFEKGIIEPEFSVNILSQLNNKQLQEKLKREDEIRRIHIKIESKLVVAKNEIKEALTIQKVDMVVVVASLHKILSLDITSMMLLKHPSVVVAISYVQRYTGKLTLDKLPEEEKKNFECAVLLIRSLADFVMEKFSSLFDYPRETVPFFPVWRSRCFLWEKKLKDTPIMDKLKLWDMDAKLTLPEDE